MQIVLDLFVEIDVLLYCSTIGVTQVGSFVRFGIGHLKRIFFLPLSDCANRLHLCLLCVASGYALPSGKREIKTAWPMRCFSLTGISRSSFC